MSNQSLNAETSANKQKESMANQGASALHLLSTVAPPSYAVPQKNHLTLQSAFNAQTMKPEKQIGENTEPVLINVVPSLYNVNCQPPPAQSVQAIGNRLTQTTKSASLLLTNATNESTQEGQAFIQNLNRVKKSEIANFQTAI